VGAVLAGIVSGLRVRAVCSAGVAAVFRDEILLKVLMFCVDAGVNDGNGSPSVFSAFQKTPGLFGVGSFQLVGLAV
jgi:hypothetical protein